MTATNGPPPNNAKPERIYAPLPHLLFLATQNYNPSSPIPSLLRTAETALDQSANLLSFHRPDLAFVEFVRASEIVVQIIPRHKDFTHFTLDQPERAKQLVVLQRRVQRETGGFEGVKEGILQNNKRYGGDGGGGGAGKVKPTPSPKPEALHGRALPAATDLNARFAGLRLNLDTKSSNHRTTASIHSSPLSMPSAADYTGRSSFEPLTLTRTSSIPYKPPPPRVNGLPQGPRGMPNGSGAPQMPAPIVIPNLPQAPQAAYSPARNMDTMNSGIAPPRHWARSLARDTNRRSSMQVSSSASSHAPSGSVDYFPNYSVANGRPNGTQPPTNGSNGTGAVPNGKPTMPGPPRRTSTTVPTEPEIEPQKLYDYVQRHHVLLIDFRSREEFDQGHIYTRNIVNIDPLSIRQGMSAEEVQDSLILSPENEQDSFAQRDGFDFVVYYDNSTATREFLEGKGDQKLKYLFEALVDFNQEKPLRRPPILLKGGLEGWVDMIGRPALAVSDTLTASKSGGGKGIRRRPLATTPAAPGGGVGNGDGLRIPKRRVRDYNPLDAEEEEFWREKARQESVALPATAAVEVSEDGVRESIEEGEEGEDPSAAIKEFLERFPEAGNLDRRAFAGQRPTRQAPQAPTGGVVYPTAPGASKYDLQNGSQNGSHGPPPALPPKTPAYPPPESAGILPQVPTRPAPAAPRMSYQGVSERTPSASQPASRHTSGQMVPYITPRLLAKNIRLPRTGLINFRNTCYMNSIIQALSATTPLSMFLLDDGFKSLLEEGNWKGSKDIGFVTVHYSNLLRNLWKGDVAVVKPSTLRAVIRRKWGEFDNEEQQDAKEFLDVVVEWLHQDLNGNWARNPLRGLSEREEMLREGMDKRVVARMEWERATHRELSFVYGVFAGQYASKLTCESCGFTSTTYDLMTSISVEIPEKGFGGRPPTLDDCLRSFCGEERLRGEERWECPRCRVPREARKRIVLTRAPQVLVVHFKRFRSNGVGRQSSKINTAVDFPLQNLDLTPYFLPTPTADEVREMGKRYRAEDLRFDGSMIGPFTYDCYAVVRHIGATMQSGHYVTAARDQGRKCWHWYNDTRVEDFRPEEMRGGERLQDGQAYVVFYQRNVNAGAGVQGKI
ncbi:ubiquitin-specific protease doa4 [Elasticomyces elasticus]|nr:ubiquitin-specific protease doa4 [Elasticomyces elasticus]